MKSETTEGPRDLASQVRLFLSRRFIMRVVCRIDTAEIFNKSQSWEGYDHACESWHEAFWRRVDDHTPAEVSKQFDAAQPDWSKISFAEVRNRLVKDGAGPDDLPATDDELKMWLKELARQEFAQQLSLFQLAADGPEGAEAETYTWFSNDFCLAANLGINAYAQMLAKQKQRKPTKDKGDRRLVPQLLVYWIPACLWAFTADGAAEALNTLHPRSGNARYARKTVSDACSDLRLFRARPPLWAGLSGSPPRLRPLL